VGAQRDQRLGHREVLAAAQVAHGLDAERRRQVLASPSLTPASAAAGASRISERLLFSYALPYFPAAP
jgi:hypothetical protein